MIFLGDIIRIRFSVIVEFDIVINVKFKSYLMVIFKK